MDSSIKSHRIFRQKILLLLYYVSIMKLSENKAKYAKIVLIKKKWKRTERTLSSLC